MLVLEAAFEHELREAALSRGCTVLRATVENAVVYRTLVARTASERRLGEAALLRVCTVH